MLEKLPANINKYLKRNRNKLSLHKKWRFPFRISSVNVTWIWSHLLKKSFIENFIFCAVYITFKTQFHILVLMLFCFYFHSRGLTHKSKKTLRNSQWKYTLSCCCCINKMILGNWNDHVRRNKGTMLPCQCDASSF